MKHRVTLDYTLGEGWLAPWVDGLREGRAVASRCTTCASARFPPLRMCPDCRRPSDGWVTLSGRATILWRTAGTDGDFALATFDGAEGAAIIRTDNLPPDTTHGRLRACPDGPLFLQLEPDPK